MKFYRRPTKQEEQLIELLIHESSLKVPEDWKNELLVCPMNDVAEINQLSENLRCTFFIQSSCYELKLRDLEKK